ncbi:MAG: glycosyltransferase family 39 protein [Elusimicrobiales bacterium]|nr:glycosyltransferase family 39 protein [Elusimicrobiales bacterium]
MNTDAKPEEKDPARPVFWGLLLFGFALRTAYVFSVKVLPWSDMASWDMARSALAAGLPYPVGWTPLYPIVLALVTKVFGESYVLFNMVNVLFSTLTCLFIYLCAKEAFGRKAGYISLVLSAVYVDMIWYCGVMMAETFGMLLLTVTVYLVIRNKSSALGGFFLGLTCMVKALFIIGLPAFLFWIYYKYKEEGWLKRAVIFTAFTFLTILPWSIRGARLKDTPTILEPTWADTIFVGHNPYATGGADFYFNQEEYGKFYVDDSLSKAEKSRICLDKALTFIRENPWREVQLFFLKISKHLSFVSSFSFYSGDYPARKTMFVLSLLENMIIFPLCVLGIAFSFKDKNAAGPIAIIAVFVGVFVTLFCAEGRKRMPFIPSVLILASYGASLLPGVIEAVKKGEAGKMRGRLGAAAVCSGLLFLNLLYQVATRYRDVLGRFH